MMLTKANICALDRLLLERFGGKEGLSLALELPRRRNPLSAWNLFLPRPSPYAARIVKPAPERGHNARCKHKFAEKRRECRAWT